MALRDLVRTPLGIIVLAYVVVVIGMAAAGFLLNVPVLLVAGGVLVAAAFGFWLVTRKDPARDVPAPPAPPAKP